MEIYDVTRTRVKEDPTRSFRLNQHNLWKQLAIEHNESISGSWVPRCWPMLMLLWTKPTRNVPINPVGTREHEEIATPDMCTITNSSDSWIAPIVHTTNGEVIADRTSVLFTFFVRAVCVLFHSLFGPMLAVLILRGVNIETTGCLNGFHPISQKSSPSFHTCSPLICFIAGRETARTSCLRFRASRIRHGRPCCGTKR